MQTSQQEAEIPGGRITLAIIALAMGGVAIGVVGGPILAIFGATRERRISALMLLGVFAIGHLMSFFAPNCTTMVVSRFISGIPHGTYFGAAALMAAQMAGPTRQHRGDHPDADGTRGGQCHRCAGGDLHRSDVRLAVDVRHRPGVGRADDAGGASLRFPSGAGRRRFDARRARRAADPPPVGGGVALAVIGFSGMSALYSYISPVMTDVAGLNASHLPFVVGLHGVGMVIGNFLGGWATEKSVLGP